MAKPRVSVDRSALAGFCRRNHIRKLSFFGSVLRADFGEDSDIDVLVEFEADARVSLLDAARMERELVELLGRPVDLRTAEDLSPYIRDGVLAAAEVHYGGT
jgi:predicted nucleotidyltransferase